MRLALLIVASALSARCNSAPAPVDGASYDGLDGTVPSCTTGTMNPCACAGGGSGTQRCNESGTYDVCQCPASPCVPGETRACACIGGRMSTQPCTPDRVYGDCPCPPPFALDAAAIDVPVDAPRESGVDAGESP